MLNGFRENDLKILTIDGDSKEPKLLLKGIANLTDLVELNLKNTAIPSEQTACLSSLKNLKILGLSYSSFDSSKLAKSPVIDNLITFDLESCVNPLPILERLKSNSVLTKLDLDKSQLTTLEIEALSKLTSLKILSLNKSGISNSELDKLVSLYQLEELLLEKCDKIDQACLEALKKFPSLQRLKISKGIFTARQIASLISEQRKHNVVLKVAIEH